MSKQKTRNQKIRSAYRLHDFKLHVAEQQTRRDVQEFGYLHKAYVKKDLMKTVVYSLIIISILLSVQYYLR